MTSSFRPDAASGRSRSWHPLTLCDGDEIGLREIAASIRGGDMSDSPPSRDEIVMRLGEVRSLVKAAERGDLHLDDWKPVVRHPELWELRLRWEGAKRSVLWRGYFHEPGARPRQTVLAHAHQKDTSTADPDAVRTRQNAAMRVAADRVTSARPCVWGLDESAPVFR